MLFDDTLSVHDVNQKEIGNCWLMAAFAAFVAKCPQALHSAFSTGMIHPSNARPMFNQQGVLSVRLFVHDAPCYMLLDDYVPRVSGGKSAFNCHNTTNMAELWPCLLEKAFAKLGGGYVSMEAHVKRHWELELGGALRLLSGSQQEYGTYWDTEKPWSDLPEATMGPIPSRTDKAALAIWVRGALVSLSQQGAMCTAGVSESTLGKLGGNIPGFDFCRGIAMGVAAQTGGGGMVSDHAYSLLWCGSVPLAAGGEQYLICMRNPWGQYEWKGQWSDGDSAWAQNPAAAAALVATGCFRAAGVGAPVFITQMDSAGSVPGKAQGNDGEFFIALEDFVSTFDSITAAGPLSSTFGQRGWSEPERAAKRAAPAAGSTGATPVQRPAVAANTPVQIACPVCKGAFQCVVTGGAFRVQCPHCQHQLQL